MSLSPSLTCPAYRKIPRLFDAIEPIRQEAARIIGPFAQVRYRDGLFRIGLLELDSANVPRFRELAAGDHGKDALNALRSLLRGY